MTTFLGAGFAPFGLSYAGYGEPSIASSINKKVLIDDFGQSANTRLIDPLIQDYRFNANGNLVGGNDIQQLVYLALLTVKGSCVVNTLGQSFTNIKVIGSNYASQIKNEVKKALQYLIDKKMIILNDVIVNRTGTNQSTIDIQWTDIATGTEFSNTI